MKDAIDSSNLDAVKEMLLDERKLVTYVSVSKDLCIHVNESKTLLTNVLSELRKISTNIPLSASYIVSGLLDNNRAQTTVCNETELSDIQAKFKTIFFQHLYSISPGNSSGDNVSYMAISKFEDFPLCTGLIKSNLCEKRPAEEIQKLRTKSHNIAIQKKTIVALPIKVKEESSKEKSNTSEGPLTKIQHTLSEPVIKTEMPSIKKTISNGNSHKHDPKNGNRNQKGIAGFFNRDINTVSKKSLVGIQENNSVENHKEIQPDKMDVEVDEVVRNHITKEDKKSTKSLDRIKKTAKVDMKRKRVLKVSDSESEDENDPIIDKLANEPESDDEIPPTPLNNTVKITSGIVNPKKRRKIVDKTYTDEDGYILTKKEEVYESCSENEEDVNARENIENIKVTPLKTIDAPLKNNKYNDSDKNYKKKSISSQKGKQATLMNFFKKV